MPLRNPAVFPEDWEDQRRTAVLQCSGNCIHCTELCTCGKDLLQRRHGYVSTMGELVERQLSFRPFLSSPDSGRPTHTAGGDWLDSHGASAGTKSRAVLIIIRAPNCPDTADTVDRCIKQDPSRRAFLSLPPDMQLTAARVPSPAAKGPDRIQDERHVRQVRRRRRGKCSTTTDRSIDRSIRLTYPSVAPDRRLQHVRTCTCVR
jgi:hypothetical protein